MKHCKLLLSFLLLTSILTAVLRLSTIGKDVNKDQTYNKKQEINDENISLRGEKDIENKHLSQILDWKDVKIKSGGYYPKFEEVAFLAENDTYLFYPSIEKKMRVVRFDKVTKEKKVIMELKEKKDKLAKLCLAEKGLIVEYADNLYYCDFDGEDTERILSRRKMNEALVQVNGSSKEEMNSDIVNGMQFYKGELYLSVIPFCVVKLDLQTKQFLKLAEKADCMCFCADKMYYKNIYDTAVYRCDLDGKNQELILGSETNDLEKEDFLYYDTVLEADGQIYYLCRTKKGDSILFLYQEEEDDKEIYRFDGENYFQSATTGSSKVLCKYRGSEWGYAYIQIYDIVTAFASDVISLQGDMFFLSDDLLFYRKEVSDENFSFFTINSHFNEPGKVTRGTG